MLQRKLFHNGVVAYVSPLLAEVGVPHAFSTRLGGISAAPFDSLNLGNPNGCAIQDSTDAIFRNYALLHKAIGVGDRERCYVHQIHTAEVLAARKGDVFDCGRKADALISDDPARVVAVRIADCVPILIASRDGGLVAAVHAGWRGVVANVLAASVEALGRVGAAPSSLIAAIGPCIGFNSFEVGAEVLEDFRKAFPIDPPMRSAANGKGFIDLRAAVRRQLLDLGVPSQAIDETDRCTFRDADEFFSHRRENGVTGRLAALIGVRA